MEGPGMSLFQGAASIHINNSAQDRLDEQEQLEDQKRLAAELNQKLENAFDDLIDDDDVSSVNSSVNFSSINNAGTESKNRIQNPPPYVEAFACMKGMYGDVISAQNGNTPQQHVKHVEEARKCHYSPYGAGDGHNQFFNRENKGHLNGVNNFEAVQEFQKHEQLKMMYEMRVKECHQLASQLEELRNRTDTEIDSLRARLTAAKTDREKAELSVQEAHQLHATYKHKMFELEQQLHALSEKLISSEQKKEELNLELRSATLSLQEAQQRFHSKQVAHNHDNDALFREQQDRHRDEMERFQEDLEKARRRLSEKENEIRILEKQCLEKDRAKEALLVEKGNIINRLARELEEAQCRLVSGETAKLKEKVAQLSNERNISREQVKELGSKLELAASELTLCRKKLETSQKEFNEFRNTLQAILKETTNDNIYFGENGSPGKFANLKEILSRYQLQGHKLSTFKDEISKRDKKLEMYRKLESELKSKLEEHKGLELQLNSKVAMLEKKLEFLGNSSENDLLESYKQQNNQLERQLDDLRMDHKNLDLKYTELEMEYEKMKSDRVNHASLAQEANADLLRELESYSVKLKDLMKDNGELKTLYLQACSGRDSVIRELQDVKSKLSTLQKEKNSLAAQDIEYMKLLESEKKQVEKLTKELTSNKDELERANKRISELQKEFNDKQKEFSNKLNQYIEEEKSATRKEPERCMQCEKHSKIIKNLEEQLNEYTIKFATQGNNEALMQELKSNAEYFQKYIFERFQKLQQQRHVATNTDHQAIEENNFKVESNENNDEDEKQDEILASRTDLMIKEKQIRDQIADKFTLEMKTIEMDCSKKLKEMENEHSCTVTKLTQFLEKKAAEIEALKKFILSERGKITEILCAKEKELSILLNENNSLQNEYQTLRLKTLEIKTHLEKAQMKNSKLKTDIERKTTELNYEKQNSAKRLNELTQQLKVLDAKTAQVETQHELLKEKYKSVKKTALVYKDYASKKDAHVESELERIRSHYQEIVTQLQNKLQSVIKKRQQYEAQEQLCKFQSDIEGAIGQSNPS